MNEIYNKYCLYLKYMCEVACAEQNIDFDSKFKELSSPTAKLTPQPKKQGLDAAEKARKQKEEQDRLAQQQRELEKAEQLKREALEAERIRKEKEEKLHAEHLQKEQNREHTAQPIARLSLDYSLNAQQELVDYINDLVPELVAGNKVDYKKTLKDKAEAGGKDGEQIVKDVQEFVKLFSDSIEDGVITKLEKASLVNMGKFAMVSAETIEKMLKPYSKRR